ncbi:diguanylate cyclase [Pelomicrobium sp. G1]|uniref:diguanylate cyclase n=1 Tax=unclassified Pelomicrobium TaxID=2815318 RepID=UPI003F76124A
MGDSLELPGEKKGFARRRFGLGTRITLGLTAVAVLVVLAGAVLRAAQESAIEILKSHLEEEARVSERVHRIRTALLEARRHDHDLALSYRQTPPEAFNARYWQPVEGLLAGVRQDLERLRGIVQDPGILREIRGIQHAVELYGTEYAALVDLHRRMGSAAGGLEAQIRDQEEQLEAAISQRGPASALERLKALRFARIDYFARHRPAEADAVRASSQVLAREIAAGPLVEPARSLLSAALDQYRLMFDRYAEMVEEASARRASLVKAVAEAEPGLDRVLSRMRSARVLAYYSVSLSDAIGYTAGIVGLITLLAAGWMVLALRRNVMRAIEASVDFARRVELGDLSARIAETETPALGRLAEVLNEMAASLKRARDQHLEQTRTLQREVDSLRGRVAIQDKILQAAQAETRSLEQQVARSAWELASALEEVRMRNREMMLFNEMSSLLHTCRSDREAFDVIDLYAARLFPLEEGALYFLSPTHERLECLAAWGGTSRERAGSFGPQACLALRRGHAHQVEDPAASPLCEHVRACGDPRRPYLCLPMAAGGDTLGILHLSFSPPEVGAEASATSREYKRDMAKALADQIALAISNIRLRETLHRQSIRDPLTGLFNRRYLEESLQREVARAERTGRPLALLMLDVDHFKRFNDSYGHEAGDAVLRALGRLLRQSVREGDIACRFGGEEFVVLLPEATLETAQERAERIRDEARRIRIHREGRYLDPVSVSFGVAIYPDHGVSAETLLAAADAALYRAKSSGRDRVMVSLRAS